MTHSQKLVVFKQLVGKHGYLNNSVVGLSTGIPNTYVHIFN